MPATRVVLPLDAGELLGEVSLGLFDRVGTFLVTLTIMCLGLVASTPLSTDHLIRGARWTGEAGLGVLRYLWSGAVDIVAASRDLRGGGEEAEWSEEDYEGDYEEEYDEEYYEDGSMEEYDEETSRLPAWVAESPYWLIAVLVHVVFLLIAATIVVFEKQEEIKDKKQEEMALEVREMARKKS